MGCRRRIPPQLCLEEGDWTSGAVLGCPGGSEGSQDPKEPRGEGWAQPWDSQGQLIPNIPVSHSPKLLLLWDGMDWERL